MKHTLCVASFWLAVLTQLGACNREHMLDHHGRQSREHFARQHVYTASAGGSPKGLDSEEAALIQASYRKTLGAEREQTGSSSVLMLRGDSDAQQ